MDLTKELLNPKEKFHDIDEEYAIMDFSKALESRTLNDWPVAEWPFGKPYESLVAFRLMVDVVMKMSWHEHTSDWNPELIFDMKDGTQICAISYEINIPDYKELMVFGLDEQSSIIKIDVLDEKAEYCSKEQEVQIDQIVAVTFMP